MPRSPAIATSLLALLLLTACASDVQTSSGAAYRAARPDADPKSGSAIDLAVAQAAKVEPLLRFPARIGLARVMNGELAAVPPREADAWIAFGQRHPEYGTYVPINPLIADMAASVAGDTAKTVIDHVRLGAARQHVDAVLVYSTTGNRRDSASPLSLLDLTVVGAYLVPSRSVRGEAMASALLLDVRNGYPYGTASATSSASGFVPSVGSGDRAGDLTEDAEVAAVGKLTAEVETMFARLRTELQDRELAALRDKQATPTPRRTRGRPVTAGS